MTPWTATHQTSLSLTSLLEFAQVHAHWSGDAIQSSHPLSCCTPPALNFFPASRSFPMSWLFASCGQSIGASVSAPVLLKSIQGWFPLRLTGLSPCFPRDSPKSYPTTQFKALIPWHSAFFIVQLSHPYVTTGKNIPLIIFRIQVTYQIHDRKLFSPIL